jgi:hypothetical protein
VEEIVHEADNRREPQRAVTVVGSYRIALPEGVSQQDVQAVHRGFSSASNITRRLSSETRVHEGSGGNNVTGMYFPRPI